MATSDKLREIAEQILSDLFEAGMDAQEVGMPSFDMLKTSGYIDRKLSDLTALIGEHYYPKEFISYLMFDCDLQKELSNDFESEDEVIDRIFDFWTNNVKQ